MAKKEHSQLEELTADLQRVTADFANYKRRSEQEKGEVMDLAKQAVVRQFLAVRDNFDRELAARPQEVDKAWAKSIDTIRASFDAVLVGLGVERFESVGEHFDPHLHEAVVMEEGDGSHEVVTEELQAGYKLGDQVLRHAVVKVGKTHATDPLEVIEQEKQAIEDHPAESTDIKDD